MGRSRGAATRTGPLNILAYRSAMMDKIICRASLDTYKSQRLYGEFVPVSDQPDDRH